MKVFFYLRVSKRQYFPATGPKEAVRDVGVTSDWAVLRKKKEKKTREMGSTERSKLIGVIDEGTNIARFAVGSSLRIENNFFLFI